jgi:hypothetical protein
MMQFHMDLGLVTENIQWNSYIQLRAKKKGLWGSEMSRLPYFPDNRITDGGEAVSLTRQLLFTPRKIPGTHFC